MDSFRDLMDQQWRAFQRRAAEFGEGGNRVNVFAKEWYRTLDPAEKQMAAGVLAEWILHGSVTQRSSSLALVQDFRIRAAEPALRQLAYELDDTPGPAARDLAEWVQRVIASVQDVSD